METEIKKLKKCPECGEEKSKKEFTRRSTHSGLIEPNFTYCNKCVGYIGENGY